MLHDNSLAMYFTFFFKFSAKSLFPGSKVSTYLIYGDLSIDIARLKRSSVNIEILKFIAVNLTAEKLKQCREIYVAGKIG